MGFLPASDRAQRERAAFVRRLFPGAGQAQNTPSTARRSSRSQAFPLSPRNGKVRPIVAIHTAEPSGYPELPGGRLICLSLIEKSSTAHPQNLRERRPRIGPVPHQRFGPARLADRGLTSPYEISYRGVKPPRVSAGFGRSDLRCIPICRSSAGARRPGGRKGRGEVERPVAMGQDQADIQDQWIEGSPGKRRLTI